MVVTDITAAIVGASVGCTAVNVWNIRRLRGHRKAAADAHRGADHAALEAAIAAQESFLAGLPSAEEPGEGASVSETPDLVDPIVGWRCWNVYNDGHLVALNGGSSYGGRAWDPRTAARAACSRRETYGVISGSKPTHAHGPHEGCSCGFYAAKLLAKAQWPEANYAYGRVAMWGKVIEHEGGYRAEYAYPVEVILVSKAGRRSDLGGGVREIEAWSDEVAENIRLRMETMYGIPVRIGSDDAMRDEWAAQYLDLPLPPQVVPLLEAAK